MGGNFHEYISGHERKEIWTRTGKNRHEQAVIQFRSD